MADALATILNPRHRHRAEQAAGVTTKPASDKTTLANNFETFLTLLTTQLKNQNPLEPLDTNQFTQQLVQFAQVEQQIKHEQQLASLVSIEQTAQSTPRWAFSARPRRSTAPTAKLEAARRPGRSARQAGERHDQHQEFDRRRPVYTGGFTVNAGQQNFCGTAAATTATSGRTGTTRCRSPPRTRAARRSRSRPRCPGTVDCVDLTKNPPVLSIGGQTFTLDKIKRVVRAGRPDKRSTLRPLRLNRGRARRHSQVCGATPRATFDFPFDWPCLAKF